MSSGRDQGRGKDKGRGESATPGGRGAPPHSPEPVEHLLRDERPGPRVEAGPSTKNNNTRRPNPKPSSSSSSSFPSSPHGRNRRQTTPDDSPRTKKARAGAIRALDRIDDLLPLVEGLQVREEPRRQGAGAGARGDRVGVVPRDQRGATGQPSRGVHGRGGGGGGGGGGARSGSSGGTRQGGRAPQGRSQGRSGGGGDGNGNENDRRRTRRAVDKDLPPVPCDPPHDLPTETYAAIIETPGFDTYLDYPARIHHLRYPVHAPGATAAATTDWEDLHLHQRVSQPRIRARWARPLTLADRARMEAYFFRFADDALGFRPYRDILLLDAAYLTAYHAHCATLRRLSRPLDPAASLIPLIDNPNHRAMVTTLAVSAAAFVAGSLGQEDGDRDAAGGPDRLCEILAAAFPGLRRLLLFAPAVVDRPASAAWDLEVEFAQWTSLTDVVRLEAEARRDGDGRDGNDNVDQPVTEFARAAGLLQAPSEGPGPLVRAVEAAWARARDETMPARRARLDAIRRRASASLIGKPAGSTSASPPVGAVEAEAGSQTNSTAAIVAVGEDGESFRAEPAVLLYYRDAFERAVNMGWNHEALVPLNHLDLGLE